MSIHSRKIHWTREGPTGSTSEIGQTWFGVDGKWHGQGFGESFGPAKTERKVKEEIEEFYRNGYER